MGTHHFRAGGYRFFSLCLLVSGASAAQVLSAPAEPIVWQSGEAAEAAAPLSYANLPGRVILDVDRLDIARLHGQVSGGQQRQMNNGALLARVSGLELIDQDGMLIHSFDVASLASADALADGGPKRHRTKSNDAIIERRGR